MNTDHSEIKDPFNEEDNSFFDSEYKKYTQKNHDDSCATGSLTYDDLTEIFGIEETQMLRDYESSKHQYYDRWTADDPQDVRSDYVFDSDELTIGELIAINDEILKKQNELNEINNRPHMTTLLMTNPDGSTQKIPVFSMPSNDSKNENSAFIAVDEIYKD